MGRPPKLSEAQWDEIGRRHIDGEAARSLALSFFSLLFLAVQIFQYSGQRIHRGR